MSNTSLFHISAEYQEIREQLMYGEATDELEASLAVTEENMSNKLQGYSHVIRDIDAIKAAAKIEIDRINDFVKRSERAENYLKFNMLKAVLEFGQNKKGVHVLELGMNRFSTRKSTSVEFVDTEKIPETYKSYDITIKGVSKDNLKPLVDKLTEDGHTFSVASKISKTEIKNDINANIQVDGAKIDTKYNLVIK